MRLGEVSADGSPVAIYAALPAEPDLSYIRHYAAGRLSVLDLGCGAGRIAEPLAREGHEVVAVDESAEMLGRLRCATPVLSRIESLQLDRRFDLVLLLSHLVNSDAAPTLLDTAVRHLAPDGLLVIQRLVPGRTWKPATATVGEVRIGIDDIVIEGHSISAVSTYELGAAAWRQPWRLWERSDAEIAALLDHAGLRAVEFDQQWVTGHQVERD